MSRLLRDLTRPTRWAARTAAMLLRRSPRRRATAALVARLWWRERRGRRDGSLELLRFRDGAAPVELWVSEFNDLHVIREAFGDGVYELPDALRPATILDFGAHLGASVLWFHRRYPDARIYAVEPDRRSFRKLQRNVGGIPGVTVHHAALAGEEGERAFYEAERGWASSLIASGGGGPATTVPVVTLRGFIRDQVQAERVDLLKIDVEGAEWEVLPSERLAELAGSVVGELHEGKMGDPDSERRAWQHGLDGFDVRFHGREGNGHFVARPPAPRRHA